MMAMKSNITKKLFLNIYEIIVKIRDKNIKLNWYQNIQWNLAPNINCKYNSLKDILDLNCPNEMVFINILFNKNIIIGQII